MTGPEKDRFRLADEPDGNTPPAPPPPPPPARDREEQGRDGLQLEPAPRVDEETGVDTRTVAERRGQAVGVVAGRRPPPQGWPAEAFAFPLRRPGPRTIAGAAVLLTLVDLVGRANFFVGLLLKVPAALVLLRWQLHVASRTAAGRDEPAGWASAMDLTREHARGVGILLVAAVLLAAPGIVADVLERPGLALVLFAAGGLWLAACALGQTVGEAVLSRPWLALAWIARRPLGLLAATAGWWAAGWTEVFLWWMRDEPALLFAAASFGMRLVGMYLWLLSARALGVVGRSSSFFGDDESAATSPGG